MAKMCYFHYCKSKCFYKKDKKLCGWIWNGLDQTWEDVIDKTKENKDSYHAIEYQFQSVFMSSFPILKISFQKEREFYPRFTN